MIDVEKAIIFLNDVKRVIEKANHDKFSVTVNIPFERAYNIDTAITALQEKQERESEPSGWISVEDRLPKSGKHVLLCCEVRPSGRKYICDGYYAEENDIICDGSDEISFQYSEEDDEYYLLEGFYEVIKNWDDFSSVVICDFVTHWQPLPEPPKEEVL